MFHICQATTGFVRVVRVLLVPSASKLQPLCSANIASRRNGSSFDAEPVDGLRTYALIYASWASSQPFYNQIEQPMEAYVEEHWLPHYRRHDPRDLIAMIDTWLEHDVVEQLPQIQAQTALVAANRDLYFTVDDMASDAALIPNCTFVQIDSLLGHRAGNPHGSGPEQRQLRAVVDQLLPN